MYLEYSYPATMYLEYIYPATIQIVSVYAATMYLECVYPVITPYIRILDFDWLIAGVFFVYFHI
jgi:hypothetical protein